MKSMVETLKEVYRVYRKNNNGNTPDTVFLPYWAYERVLIESTSNYPAIDVMSNKVLGMSMIVYVKGFVLDTIFVMKLSPCYEQKAMMPLEKNQYVEGV